MSQPGQLLTDEMRQQAIGCESPRVTTEVEKGAIIKFAQAIGDDNPLFADEVAARSGPHGGLVAPPTFLRSIPVGRPELPFDLSLDRVLDGGSDWQYFEPVRPGDRITAVATITDITERAGRLGTMVISTVVYAYRNQFNQMVATQTSTTIRY